MRAPRETRDVDSIWPKVVAASIDKVKRARGGLLKLPAASSEQKDYDNKSTNVTATARTSHQPDVSQIWPRGQWHTVAAQVRCCFVAAADWLFVFSNVKRRHHHKKSFE